MAPNRDGSSLAPSARFAFKGAQLGTVTLRLPVREDDDPLEPLPPRVRRRGRSGRLTLPAGKSPGPSSCTAARTRRGRGRARHPRDRYTLVHSVPKRVPGASMLVSLAAPAKVTGYATCLRRRRPARCSRSGEAGDHADEESGRAPPRPRRRRSRRARGRARARRCRP